MHYLKHFFSISVLTFLLTTASLQAQPALQEDYSFVMNVPSVITIASSPAHFYVLSETEGMAVFRSRPDSLQWLYSSAGMQRRGNKVIADVRFAYLFGDSPRLTVLEPTSVLGVYSSTELPGHPLDVNRMGRQLYVALGEQGLGQLSLETADAVDSGVAFVAQSDLDGQEIVSLEGNQDRLFVLAVNQKLFQFEVDGEELSLTRTMDLSESLINLFWVDEGLYGSDSEGNIFEIENDGDLSQLGGIEERVSDITAWKDWLIIRGESNRLWASYEHQSPQLWKQNKDAGNHIAISKGNLWISQYGQITRVNASDVPSDSVESDDADTTVAIADTTGSFGLQEIRDYTVPHTKPLLFPIKIEGNIPPENVRFTYQSPDIQGAEVRGQSFYWKPSSNDIGSHTVKIIASTSDGRSASATFDIHVRSFNSPPRFTPVRPVSIPVGKPFSMPLNAVDSDGINKDLIRFLGVNLPDGASIDESSGTIEWTPTARQVGENTFRIIATDQYGAASSVDVTINVIDNIQHDESDN